jgi:alpha-L-fucosidase
MPDPRVAPHPFSLIYPPAAGRGFSTETQEKANPMVIKRLLHAVNLLSLAALAQVSPPAPFGAVPSERHLRWHERETYVLVHFTPTTFENKEWGYGDADPSVFNPSAFDASQIVSAAKAGGFKGLILVAKHHDGFALWPTSTTSYNISRSPWRQGRGDMVREFSDACRSLGLGFGVYCSPWDRNHPDYGKPAYVEAYRRQLSELYSNYGPLFMSWHDGANGGDGYYGGARETRKIDRTTYYGWDSTWSMTRRMQPMASIFSDVGWDVRWVGNERGEAAETSWATFTPTPLEGKAVAGPGEVRDELNPMGTRNGRFWMPAECDVPLRKGWFYHPEQDNTVKSPEQLFELYLKSVGRGAALDIGIAPDRRGRLHENDVASLAAFGGMLERTFRTDLARTASVRASNVRGGRADLYGTRFLTDGDRYSHWATDDKVRTPALELEWKSPVVFDIVRIREDIRLGQRIDSLEIDAMVDGVWKTVGKATSIGSCRIVRFERPVTTKRCRIRITGSQACAVLGELGMFLKN